MFVAYSRVTFGPIAKIVSGAEHATDGVTLLGTVTSLIGLIGPMLAHSPPQAASLVLFQGRNPLFPRIRPLSR